MHVPPSALVQSNLAGSFPLLYPAMCCPAGRRGLLLAGPTAGSAGAGSSGPVLHLQWEQGRYDRWEQLQRPIVHRQYVWVVVKWVPCNDLLLQTTTTADGDMPQRGKASWTSRAACRAALTRQVRECCAVTAQSAATEGRWCQYPDGAERLSWLLRRQPDSLHLPSGPVQGWICERRTF